MFCNNCGKELIAGQQFCSACGQPVGVSPVPSSANRVRENIQILGILWLVYSGFALLGAIALWVVANVIFGGISRMQTEAQIPGFLHPLLSSIAFLIVATARFADPRNHVQCAEAGALIVRIGPGFDEGQGQLEMGILYRQG